MRRIRSNKKKQISTKYMLWILTGLCVVAIFAGLIFNINGGPLNTLAGYIFVPMQQGINSTGSWIVDKTNEFQTIKEVMKENEELQKEINKLREQLGAVKLDQAELENYRELYELDQKYPTFEKVAATVVAIFLVICSPSVVVSRLHAVI
jgi:rod shape-determining protein MreC